MLLLAKLFGILTMIWFYLTGKKLGEPPIKWAVIGLVGYWITWWLADLLILGPLSAAKISNTALVFVITQIPAVLAVLAAVFIRKKLISSTENSEE